MDDDNWVSDSSKEGCSHHKSSVRKDFVPKFGGFAQQPKDCGLELFDRFQFGFAGLPPSEWKALEPLWENGFGTNSVKPLSFPPGIKIPRGDKSLYTFDVKLSRIFNLLNSVD